LRLSRFTEWGIRPTPLVPLSTAGVRIFAKCEWHLPTGSLKDRIAAAMIDRGISEGTIGRSSRLIEPSSGNTGIALARIAALEGIDLTVVMPDNVTAERTQLLEAFGAHIVFSAGDRGSNGAVKLAEEMARSEDYVMLHQYENRANPEAHELTTGPEIIEDLTEAGISRLDAFVACLGTGGTLMGCSRALRDRFPDMTVVAAEPPVGELIAGLRSLDDGYVPPIFDPGSIDRKLLVRFGDAVSTTRRLLTEHGLFVGPSSGAAVHAALRVATGLEPGQVVVVVLPDAGWKYLSTGIYSGDPQEAGERVRAITLW